MNTYVISEEHPCSSKSNLHLAMTWKYQSVVGWAQQLSEWSHSK